MQRTWLSHHLIIHGLLLLAILLEQTPVPFFSRLAMPALSLCVLFYWSVRTPRYVPMWSVFLLALIADMLSGSPAGMHPLLWLLFCFGIHQLRGKFSTICQLPFYWMMFLLFNLLYWISDWLLFSIYYQQLFSTALDLQLWLSTSLIYAPLHSLFDKIHLKLDRKHSF